MMTEQYVHFCRPFLKTHGAAVILSLAIGFFIVLPQLIFMFELGPQYRGIYLFKTDAELHYVARMQHALHGGGTGNPFIAEYRDAAPSGFYSYVETVLVAPARVFPVSIPTLNLAYKFLLPVVLSLLVYSLVFRLSGRISWALVAMVAVVLGSTVFNVGTLLNILQWDLWYQQFLLFSRPISPILSLIVFLIYAHVLLTAHRDKKLVWYLLLGVLLGLSWYLYLYLALFIIALEGAFLLLTVFYRDFSASVRHALTVVTGLAVGSPGIWDIFSITTHPYYPFLAEAVSLEHTRMPYLHDVWLMVTAAFLLFCYYNRLYPNRIFIGSFLLASLISVNQQILTGLSLQSGKFLTYYSVPIYIIIVCVLAGEYFKNRKKLILERTLQLAVAGYAICAAAFIQYSSYQHWAPLVKEEQRYAPALEWLGQLQEREAVVMASPELSALIPVFTRHAVMWEEHAVFYLLPQERRAYTPPHALNSKDFCAFLDNPRVDYIVWDKLKDADWDIENKDCADYLVSLDDFSIYKKI